MKENENLVSEQIDSAMTENVEQTTEPSAAEQQQPKLYTKEEVDGIVGKKKARWEANSNRAKEKEMAPHNQIMDLLKAGTGKQTPEEIIDHLQKFYGNPMPAAAQSSAQYSEKDLEILAKAEAAEIISAGEDEVADELERLAALGKEGMSSRDKALFVALANHQKETEWNSQLSQLGIPKEVYESDSFRKFASKFAAATPVREVYDLYQSTQPQKEISTAGSLRNTGAPDDGIKDFYTPEEAAKFSVKDFNDNPKLWKAVNESRLRWKK